MRNAIIVALGLVCAALILSSATSSAERIKTGGGGGDNGGSGANDSVPVAVQNFPATQTVRGAVDVKNFPLVVTVEGTVDVDNLPLDAEGNVRVAGELGMGSSAVAHFVGITAGTVEAFASSEFGGGVYSILDSNFACQAEFSDTRICLWPEIAASMPAVQWDDHVVVARNFLSFLEQGTCINTNARTPGRGVDPPCPVACCGF